MRKRLYEIIEAANSAEQFDLASLVYDVIIISAVLLSIFPLALKQEPEIFTAIDKGCAGIFIVDYLLRLSTADFKYGEESYEADALKLKAHSCSFQAVRT